MASRLSGLRLLGFCGLLFLLTVLAFPAQGFATAMPKFVYVTNRFSTNVSGYTFDAATGALTPVPGSPFAAVNHPALLAVDSAGKFAYVANEFSNNVSAYTVDASSGALTPVPGSPFAAGTNPFGVAIDPSGRFAYVTNESGNISAYTIDASSGALTPVAGSPIAAGSGPYGVAVDPSGKFVYVTNQSSSNVSAYTIDASSGALTPVAGSPFAAGTNPALVAVDPSGKFVYVTNVTSGDVSAYTIDASSGALTPVAGSPFAAGSAPFGVAVDPSGKFVYVTNQGSNNVSAYTLDASSGALTPVAGSPFAAGANPLAVAVDPSGTFVYLVNYLSNTASGYTINAISGALTPVSGSPFSVGTNPVGIAITPACVPAPAGLVSWWKGEGNAKDSAAGTNDGTLEGSASFSGAKVGQGFTFANDGDGVTVPHNPDLDVNPSGFTVEFWMKGTKNQPEGLATVLEKSHGFIDATGWALQLENGTGRARFAIGTGASFPEVFSGVDVLDGNFHHIVGTWDGSNMRLYVDGVLQGVTPLATPANNTRGVNIGFAWGGGTPQRFFRGTVDEPAIFSRALAAAEIQGIFNAGPKGKCPCTPPPSGMVAWWPGEGNANDIVGGHNGTLQNGASFGSGEVGQGFSMNGAGQWVDLGTSFGSFGADDFTIDYWVLWHALDGEQVMIEKWDNGPSFGGTALSGWTFTKVGTFFQFGGAAGGGYTPVNFTVPNLNTEAWHHFAVTRSSGFVTIYWDSAPVASVVIPNIDPTANPLTLGRRSDGRGLFHNGLIDEVEVFNRALSAEEVAAIFNAGGAGKCRPRDLTCSKTATASFDRTFNWNILKTVDKTKVNKLGGGTATFNYTVNAGQNGAPVDGNWMVTGDITVTNPNDWEDFAGVTVTDANDNGGSCVVAGGTNVTVPAGGSVALPYACNYSSAPSSASGTNTATAAWDASAHLTLHSAAQGSASFAFGNPANNFNQNVTVNDTFNSVTSTLGSLTGTNSGPFPSSTFNYGHALTIPQWNCTSYPNTARIVETGQASGQTVRVCGPVRTGALAMGYWQNKNGQSIISTGASTTGVCNSGTWLRQYAPFQNLGATASCSQVASYAAGAIKAANSSGASMNAMLKGQMLATALDVYFSDPGLVGNKVGAPAPIGGVGIDLTQVCSMIDSSSGSATCSGTFQNAGSAFGGATSKTVLQILAYAASQSNSGGSVWYGNIKATQQLAKNTCDAINNQVAFAP